MLSKLAELTQSVEVDIIFHNNVDWKEEHIEGQIAARSNVELDDIQFYEYKARCKVHSDRLPIIANMDAVRRIEEVGEVVTQIDKASMIINPPLLSSQTANNIYQGSGQVIAIADTGLDLGDLTNMHPAFGYWVVVLL
ncbi:hypothetical protein GGR51DRAFT_538888 [Nemania sp. FL0031]|nr:hypothetical protein GGR51DRAFT_538888 [Nemania sp. FL0031]